MATKCPTPRPRPPRNVTSVGALVTRGEALLVVRMTYGPSQGRYMLPGGLLDPGETLDVAAAREVREETGVVARVVGLVGVRTRYEPRDGSTDSYTLWQLAHETGEPRADDRENDDARYMPFAEIAEREDVVYLVKYLAARLASGALRAHTYVDDYAYQSSGTTRDSWKLYV